MKNNKSKKINGFSITNLLSSSELILGFVLLFIMFTTPIVTTVMLHLKLDISMDQANQWEQLSSTTVAYAFIKAMLLEFLVMVLLVNGYKKTSIGFTLTTGIVSLYCFNQFAFTEGIPKLSIEIIYAFIFPLVTAICSHIYIERKQKEQDQSTETNRIESETIGKLQEENVELNHLNVELSSSNAQLESYNDQLKEQIEEVQTFEDQQRLKNKVLTKEVKSLTKELVLETKKVKKYKVDAIMYVKATSCTYCGKKCSPKGVSVHESKCKSNPKNMKKSVEQLSIDNEKL